MRVWDWENNRTLERIIVQRLEGADGSGRVGPGLLHRKESESTCNREITG